MTLVNIHREKSRETEGGEGTGTDTGCPSLNPLSAGFLAMRVVNISLFRPVPFRKRVTERGRESFRSTLPQRCIHSSSWNILLSFRLFASPPPNKRLPPCRFVASSPSFLASLFKKRNPLCSVSVALGVSKTDRDVCPVFLFWPVNPPLLRLLTRASVRPPLFFSSSSLTNNRASLPLLKEDKLITLSSSSSSPRSIDFCSHKHHYQSFLLISLPNKPNQRLLVMLRQSSFSSRWSPTSKR